MDSDMGPMGTFAEGYTDASSYIGLPSRGRYNWLLSRALDQLKAGGDFAKSEVFARLAQAEATILANDYRE